MGQVDLRKYPARPPSSRLSPRETSRAQEVKRLVLEEKRSGIWPLGTSDGFDAHVATSGLMLWNDGFALLVDPPSHTLDYFAAVGIPLDRIRGVIVTHGHSDHYADAIPKLVAARPDLKLYSTPTIYEMLQEQYRLALNRDDLKNWEFVPIRPMVETEINGMPFTVDYTFHTIPTIGFEIWREGELRFYFSGDTYADIERLEKLMNTDIDGSEEPVIGFWRGFRIQRHGLYLYWGSLQETPPVILMEGGMPPIHTPPASTRALLVQAKQDGINTSRFFVYHLSNKRARKEHVPKLREGAEGWIDLTPNASGS